MYLRTDWTGCLYSLVRDTVNLIVSSSSVFFPDSFNSLWIYFLDKLSKNIGLE